MNANHDFLKSWWWFEPANASEQCEAALAWETLRRTKTYRALWRKWSKERSVFDRGKAKPSFALFKNAHLFGQAKDAIGGEYLKLLWNGFDPFLHWLELSQAQRLDARGFIVAGKEAVKLGAELTLPWALDSLPAHTRAFAGRCRQICQRNRNSAPAREN